MSDYRPLQDDDVIVELGDGNLYHFSPGDPPELPEDGERFSVPLGEPYEWDDD